ncbi:MAG: hypothetical protein KAG96_04455 [Ichthyobacteriaceae bacterium]|nr:hypothetical protein [Ichthyobacteriaceae bacterium]
MDNKTKLRIPTIILFITTALSGGYLAYIQFNGSDNIYAKLISLLIFVSSMYLSTKNWVKENPEKNKKTWSESDRV